MAQIGKAIAKYNLDPVFERAVVERFCGQPSFYSAVVKGVDPRCMPSAPAKLLLEAAIWHGQKSGMPPSSITTVLQVVRAWITDGKSSNAQLREATAFIEQAWEDRDNRLVPSDADLLARWVPELRFRIQGEVIHEMLQNQGKNQDLAKLVSRLSDAQQLGNTRAVTSVSLEDSGSLILASRHAERLMTGIPELDLEVNGLERGQLGFVIGTAGGGKSMFLSHQTAEAATQGKLVAYATLELGIPTIAVRLDANLTQLPINGILNDDDVFNECVRRRDYLKQQGTVMPEIGQFDATASTVRELDEWLTVTEHKRGRPVEVLVVDYADKLAHGKGSMYEGMYEVYEGLRQVALRRRMWVWTASQAQRKDKKILDLNDAADSQHKVRSADQAFTVNVDKATKELWINIVKHRTGAGDQLIGPLSPCFAEGRFAELPRHRQVF